MIVYCLNGVYVCDWHLGVGHLTVEHLTVRCLVCTNSGVGDQCKVCQYVSVSYVVGFTRSCPTWYICIVFYADDCEMFHCEVSHTMVSIPITYTYPIETVNYNSVLCIRKLLFYKFTKQEYDP